MNIYPAIRGTMGRWQYYNVKMSMRELADNVNFAADIYDDKTLDDAIQRVLDESRVKTDLVTYLIRQPDRFFSSVVVAALKGHPQWYPIHMEADERFALFRGDKRLRETFGVLSFDGTQNYYALDGQHRLAAIKALVDPNSDVHPDAPKGFRDEEISVIIVVPMETETHSAFLTRYRRLFGNLNRYAKPTDAVTNIIMDEDDAFAIVTRRLITEHTFFQYSGSQSDSVRVKTKKGKNLRSTDLYFTSLETLYAMNIALLSSRHRKNNGWNAEGVTNHKDFSKFRPDEDVLDALFDELCLYWNALIGEVPDLTRDPWKMRDHEADSGDGSTEDSFLFWPIGQEVMAKVARDLMDQQMDDPSAPDPNSVQSAVRGLGALTWDGHAAPWRNLLLVPDDGAKRNWRVRSEERKRVLDLVRRILWWQLGLEELTDEEIDDLRTAWASLLLPALDDATKEELWSQIETTRLQVEERGYQ